MSTDAQVTKDLMKVLKDGEEGFTKAAKEMSAQSHTEISSTLEKFANQRASYYADLERLAKAYGDDIEESGSLSAKLHRGWMSVKEVFSGSDAAAILDVAEQGEDHAKSVYAEALKDDISTDFRGVVQRQYEGICAAHDEVKRLRNAAQSVEA